VAVARAGSELLPLWRFLTFTQNLGLRPGTAFSHAWSLCIEEQFYLLLPAAGSATGAVVNIVLSLLAGWLLYRAVERPFLALRDRWAPTNLKDAAVPVQRFLSTTQPIE
jgi:peptidoglycan/LPS O-acetylase OafA/YrhL